MQQLFIITYLLLVASPLILLLLFVARKHNQTSNAFSLPPGPAGLPLIGNLHQVDTSAPHRYLWQLSRTYGPLATLRLGGIPVVIVSSAKMVREVMKTQDVVFCSRPSSTGVKKMCYGGLDIAFAPYGAYWRGMRKICAVHLFNLKRVQSFRPVREYEVSKLIDKISKTSSQPFDLSAAMMSLTSTIICRVAFGKRYDEGADDERCRFQSLLNASQAIFTSFFFSDHFPALGFVDTLTGLTGRLDKNFRECDVFYQEIIDEHLDPNRAKPEQEDILDVLLQIQKDESFKIQLSFDHIKAILMDMFVGATDSSAASVIWSMTYLMKNPTAMSEAQKEVRHAVGKKGFVNEDDIEKLSYLKAVVKETMRLQPTIPLIPRESIRKCSLGGYDIPAKTRIQVNLWAVGRDPEVWGDNPEEYKPERFIAQSIDVNGLDFKITPFGAGRRMCPGIHMGLINVELTLANLLYAFDWHMPSGMKSADLDVELLPGITMHKKNALRLVPRTCE